MDTGNQRGRIPLILYGDGPRLHSGLARIARDLGMRLVAEQEELGIRFAQVGVDYPGGWQWQPWDFCGFQPTNSDQGRDAVESVVVELGMESSYLPIVFMIMDPARCWDLTRTAPHSAEDRSHHPLPCQFWGYFPLDAHNQHQKVGGPAALAIQDTHRLLGYGRYGAALLKRTRHDHPSVSYLPHGIDTHTFSPGVPLGFADPAFQRWAVQVPVGAIKLGAVATNQPRKDMGLLFQTIAALKDQGESVALWLHTDLFTKAWDVGELVKTCGLARHEIAVSIDDLTDLQMAARYGWADVTIAPGLGEGFGYPIVESLACGTPVMHGRYAGGVELIPHPGWLLTPLAWRLESVYALLRPVFSADQLAGKVLEAYAWTRQDPQRCAAYCSGAVAHLDWQHLWPRWRAWISQGLRQARTPKEEILNGQGRESQHATVAQG